MAEGIEVAWIVHQRLKQVAHGHINDGRAHIVLVIAHAVTCDLAHLRAGLVGHALRQALGRQPPRLRYDDAARPA